MKELEREMKYSQLNCLVSLLSEENYQFEMIEQNNEIPNERKKKNLLIKSITMNEKEYLIDEFIAEITNECELNEKKKRII